MASKVEPVQAVDTAPADSTPLEPEAPVFPVHPSSRHKTQKDLEKEEILRKLQGLVAGDKLYFKKSTLGQRISRQETPTSNDFVEAKFVCWVHNKMTAFLIVHIAPYGRLRFRYGDLYQMAICHDLFFHKLDNRYIKLLKSDHAFVKKFDTKFRHDTLDHDGVPPNVKNDLEALKQKLLMGDFKNRPTPPGVEALCKCKFGNKLEFVKKLRGIIKTGKHKFAEKTANMRELRLIATQNVRAYELEMIGYVMGEDPWAYSTNPGDKPKDEQIKEIVEQYKSAVSTPIYLELYNNWLEHTQAQAQAAQTNPQI